MLARKVNSPLTSSAGRLFDAVASLCGLTQRSRFEGDAAMRLEFALEKEAVEEAYPFVSPVVPEGERSSPLVIDWGPAIQSIIEDRNAGVGAGRISARFHNYLVKVVVEMAKRFGQEQVLLSGGCFQNRYLTEKAVAALEGAGLHPFWHQRVPPNDGGISLGQVVAALREKS